MLNTILITSTIIGLNLIFTFILRGQKQINFSSSNKTNFISKKYDNVIVGVSIIATALGSGSTIGAITGIVNGKLEYLLAFLISVHWILFIRSKIVNKLKIYPKFSSAYEIFNYHYKSNYLNILILILEIIFCTGHLSAQLAACFYLMNMFLEKSELIMILTFLSVIYYTFKGGYKIVVFTDWLQYPLVIIGFLVLTYYCHHLTINNYDFTVTSNIDYYSAVKYSLIFTIMSFYPTFLTRLNSLEELSANKALNITYYTYLIYSLLIGYISIKIMLFLPSGLNLEDKNIFYDIISGFDKAAIYSILIALIFSIITTSDSDLEHASSSITKLINILSNNHSKSLANLISNKIIYKLIVIILGLLTMIIALKFDNILEFIIFVAGFWAPSLFIPLLGCFFRKIIQPIQLIITITITCLSFLLLSILNLNSIWFEPILVSTGLNFILYMIFYRYN
jgi:Na+/proline symporter